MPKIEVHERIFFNERVDVYKIDDSLELRKAEGKRDWNRIKNLAKKHWTIHNTVCNNGLEMICRAMARDANIQAKDEEAETWVNICTLGTSSAAHSATSTALHAEVYRKLISSREHREQQFKTISYYNPAECSGNYREEGVFIEGDEDIIGGEGYLLSVVILTAAQGNKATTEALLIERTFTLS